MTENRQPWRRWIDTALASPDDIRTLDKAANHYAIVTWFNRALPSFSRCGFKARAKPFERRGELMCSREMSMRRQQVWNMC